MTERRGDARNQGIQAATGEILVFTDADNHLNGVIMGALVRAAIVFASAPST